MFPIGACLGEFRFAITDLTKCQSYDKFHSDVMTQDVMTRTVTITNEENPAQRDELYGVFVLPNRVMSPIVKGIRLNVLLLT